MWWKHWFFGFGLVSSPFWEGAYHTSCLPFGPPETIHCGKSVLRARTSIPFGLDFSIIVTAPLVQFHVMSETIQHDQNQTDQDAQSGHGNGSAVCYCTQVTSITAMVTDTRISLSGAPFLSRLLNCRFSQTTAMNFLQYCHRSWLRRWVLPSVTSMGMDCSFSTPAVLE